jgi:uncharacterized membrane protein
MSLPDPLHPAIVHFPIALILLGSLLAVLSFFRPAGTLPRFTALILCLAALGAVAATWTGDNDEDRAEEAGPAAEQILEEHEEWAERSRNAAIIAALAAGVAAILQKRSPHVSRGAAALTALVALGASWCVIQAGHYGGKLVYQHAVGVSQGDAPPIQKKPRHQDND